MARIDLNKIPRFSELPINKDAPADSSWGVFGDDYELGCLNFLTPEGVVEAARLVHNGKVFRLDMKVGYGEPTLFGRAIVRHKIIRHEGPDKKAWGHDDMLDNYNTQEGSQWDGLAHVAHPSHGFYNGVTQDDIKSGSESKLSIHKWANKFVGRGTLIDVFKYRNDQGRPLDPLTKAIYSLDDLKGALKAQGTQFKPGGILLVHTGWMQAYLKAPADQKREMAPIKSLKACGIEASRAMAEWLWDNRVAAIGTDCPSVESWPFEKSPLHIWALPLAGLPLGEQFELAPLAADCAQDGRYEFMVVSAPLNVEGGIASPPNAVAIK